MKSIRFFLVVVLLATMTLIIFLSALHGYRSSMVEVKALLDEEIANRARLLGIAGGSQTPDITIVRVSEPNAFQIMSRTLPVVAWLLPAWGIRG